MFLKLKMGCGSIDLSATDLFVVFLSEKDVDFDGMRNYSGVHYVCV